MRACVHTVELGKGNLDSRSLVDNHTIRVVSGSICWRQKTFTRLCIGPVLTQAEGIEEGWEQLRCEHIKETLYVK